MIYLLLSLLGFGLIQSLLELLKDTEKPSKRKIQNILAAVYILGFIVAVIITFRQENQSSHYNELIGGISLSVTKIDSSSADELKKLSESLKETKFLIGRTDSMNKNMTELIIIRDSLMVQTRLINDKLLQQVNIDKQTLKEKEAKVALIDNDIKWLRGDSTANQLEVCIKNFGKRNAIINSGIGYIVFFDHQKKPFFHIIIPGNNRPSILPPNELEGTSYCFNSWVVNDFKSLKANTYFAVICLRVKYKDVLTEVEQTDYFYSGWLPAEKEFGGLRDWQTELAKQWASANNIL